MHHEDHVAGRGATPDRTREDRRQYSRDPRQTPQITRARLRELQHRLANWSALTPTERRAFILGEARP